MFAPTGFAAYKAPAAGAAKAPRVIRTSELAKRMQEKEKREKQK
jgi:hypothetical protein